MIHTVIPNLCTFHSNINLLVMIKTHGGPRMEWNCRGSRSSSRQHISDVTIYLAIKIGHSVARLTIILCDRFWNFFFGVHMHSGHIMDQEAMMRKLYRFRNSVNMNNVQHSHVIDDVITRLKLVTAELET